MRMAQEQVVVGIDVAKEKVDVAIRRGAEGCFANDSRGRRQLLAWLKEHAVGQAVMEASGGYEKSWAQLLRKAGVEVVIVDPKRVRHFAKSAGQLAKNDPIDARMIVWFGEAFEHRGKPEDAAREELDQLVTARRALSQLKEKIDNWGEHEQPKAVQKAYQALLREVDRQQARLEALIADRIEQTESFSLPAEIIRASRASPATARRLSSPSCLSSARSTGRPRQPCWASLPSTTTAANGAGIVTSRADGASCDACCSRPSSGPQHGTIPS